MKQVFANGSVIFTGNDIYEAFLANRRNGYKKTCDYCLHENTDRCDDCSRLNNDKGCSCHINPPCSFCEKDGFEPTNMLINFKNYSSRPKIKFDWETFPTKDIKVFEKYNLLEKQGLVLSAEIINNNEIAVYLDKDTGEAENNQYLEICKKLEFKKTATKMILDWKESK